MPGITGIISPAPANQKRSVLDQMLGSMMREAFYASGSELFQAAGVAAGWTNLKNSFSDCLPVWNETRDICLLFYGEVFPDDQEFQSLRQRGHVFAPGNATSLVHQYEEHGDEFLRSLNGAFVGLLLDLRQGRAVLFNDRYGNARIYFHEAPDGFYFSSEAKALLRVLPETRRLDPKGLGEFFACGNTLQNRTLFSGISLLPPGSAWTFASGRLLERRTYFSPSEWENLPTLSPHDYYAKLKETWQRLLPRYFRGEQPIGLSLTGGVDSRMILAWAARKAGSLPCYTFGGRYRDCADVKISRRVAEVCGQRHEVIPLGEEFLKRFPALAKKSVLVSDGAMDVTGAVDLHVQEVARGIAPVRVTGTNGGEILRSLVAFGPSSAGREILDAGAVAQTERAEQTYASELIGRPLTFTAFKQAPWHMGSKFALERSQVTLRMPYFDNDLIKLVYQAPAEAATSNEISRRMIADGNPELAKIGTDRGGAPCVVPGVQSLQAMVQEFFFKAEYAADYGMPASLAKADRFLAPLHWERLFLGRHKTTHFRLFYRDALRDFIRETLLDSKARQRSWLDREKFERAVEGHTSGRFNATKEIHKALTMELIQRHLVEQAD
ncbi:MAG: hypothetical protein RLY20_906 [Verrucomicrobiota bacterium]|jgi:asparagine synthase (glutamine-hydrolysing)